MKKSSLFILVICVSGVSGFFGEARAETQNDALIRATMDLVNRNKAVIANAPVTKSSAKTSANMTSATATEPTKGVDSSVEVRITELQEYVLVLSAKINQLEESNAILKMKTKGVEKATSAKCPYTTRLEKPVVRPSGDRVYVQTHFERDKTLKLAHDRAVKTCDAHLRDGIFCEVADISRCTEE